VQALPALMAVITDRDKDKKLRLIKDGDGVDLQDCD
jgi:hypothetical protein